MLSAKQNSLWSYAVLLTLHGSGSFRLRLPNTFSASDSREPGMLRMTILVTHTLSLSLSSYLSLYISPPPAALFADREFGRPAGGRHITSPGPAILYFNTLVNG